MSAMQPNCACTEPSHCPTWCANSIQIGPTNPEIPETTHRELEEPRIEPQLARWFARLIWFVLLWSLKVADCVLGVQTTSPRLTSSRRLESWVYWLTWGCTDCRLCELTCGRIPLDCDVSDEDAVVEEMRVRPQGHGRCLGLDLLTEHACDGEKRVEERECGFGLGMDGDGWGRGCRISSSFWVGLDLNINHACGRKQMHRWAR